MNVPCSRTSRAGSADGLITADDERSWFHLSSLGLQEGGVGLEGDR